MADEREREEAKPEAQPRPEDGEAGGMAPSDWRTPEGIGPDDIVSSGGSGDVRSPPSGALDEGRRDP